MSSNNVIFLAIIFWSLLGSESIFAQSNQKSSKKKTSINFEDELVEGEVQKPELVYLLNKRNFNFKRLIKLRKNFLPEMRKTAEDIQPIGSGD